MTSWNLKKKMVTTDFNHSSNDKNIPRFSQFSRELDYNRSNFREVSQKNSIDKKRG